MANIQPTINVDGSVSDPINGSGTLDWNTLVPTIIGKFIAVLEAALILLAAIFIMRYIRSRFRKMEVEHEQQKTAINLLEKITSGFTVVMAITLALKVVGIDMTLLVSVAILGLSYGLQDIIKNYVAGILILFKSPFKIGDIIKIREHTGRVSNIDFQSTTLQTFDKRHVTIYNSDVMTQSIVNFTRNDLRRQNFDVMIGYGSDVHAALKVFDRILSANTEIQKSPKHSISFKSFGENGPIFTLKFWVKRPCNIHKIKTNLAASISQAFDEDNILTPYSKGIEAEDETILGKITDNRKKRIETFYQSFKEDTSTEAANIPLGPNGELLEPVVVEEDYDEPEE